MIQTNSLTDRSQYIVYPEARRREPLPVDPVEIQPPRKVSAPPDPPGLSAMLVKVVVPMLFIGFIMFLVPGGINTFIFFLLPVMTGVVTGGIQWWQYQQQKADYLNEKREVEQEYRAYLQEKEEALQRVSQLQSSILWEQHPPVTEMVNRAERNRNQLWERLPYDDDFLTVRAGTTTVPLCVPLRVADGDEKAPLYGKVVALKQQYGQVSDAPLTVNFRELGTVGLRGRQRDTALQVANSLLAHLATHHSPELVRIYVISHHADAPRRWSWIRWLPHANTLLDTENNSLHISYMTETDDDVLVPVSQRLRQRLNNPRRASHQFGETEPHLVIVFDNVLELRRYQVANLLLSHHANQVDGHLGASALFIGNVPPQVNGQIDLSDNLLEYRERWTPDARQVVVSGKPELTTTEQVTYLARRLAPLRPEGGYQTTAGSLPANVRLVELLKATRPEEVDFDSLYQTHYDPQSIMAFPVGLNVDARPQVVILREDGRGGHGHHMLLAGATGKGKSVALSSIVLSLAAHNPPDRLNFILADFKGGASELARLRHLPHVVGFVTDLDEAYVERFRLAMEGEILYRKHLFDKTPELLGRQIQNIYEYNKAYPNALLPHLVVVIDEFAKAVQVNPEFKNTIEKEIARQGRALGMHLILSSQKAIDFMTVRPNIEVRMSMQLQTSEDSRAIFNRDDAARKLTRAGQAFVQVGDNQIFEMFQVARADIPYQAAGTDLSLLDDFIIRRLLSDGRREVLYHHRGETGVPDHAENGQTALGNQEKKQHSEAEVLVEQIRHFCQGKYDPPRTICLPPLPPATEMPLAPLLAAEPAYCRWQAEVGWDGSEKSANDWLQAPIGKLDLPLEQAQRPFLLDLTRNDGHLVISGPPGAGKGLTCRTLVMALAATHPPDELLFYFVGGAPEFFLFEELPHCQALIQRNETERITRLFTYLSHEAQRRAELLRDHKVASSAALRQAQPDMALPAFVVLFGDFVGFMADNPAHADVITRLIAKGNRADIHFVFSVSSLRGSAARVLQNSANRLLLGVKSGADTLEMFGQRSKPLPETPGRGYVLQEQTLLECQIAAPTRHVPATAAAEWNREETRNWIAAIKESWSWADGNSPIPAIVELPTYIDLHSLWRNHPVNHLVITEAQTAAVGLDYDFLSPVYFNFGKLQPYNLVLGPPQSGKTDFLVTLCLSTAVNLAPTQIEMYLLSLRDSSPLRLLRRLPHIQFASSPAQARKLLTELADILANRLAEQSAFHEQADVLVSEVTRIVPKRTVILIDDLHRLNQHDELNKLVDRCMDYANSLGVCLFVADAAFHINQARQNFTTRYIQTACRFSSGLAFSLDPDDLALLNQTGKLSNPQLNHHRSRMGKGRAVLATDGRTKIVQIARSGGTNLPVALYEKEIRRVVQEIGKPYGRLFTDGDE